MNNKEFAYIIATYWPGTNRLKIYTYHSEIHYGTKREAKTFLEYVKRQSPNEDWRIMEINTTEII